MDCSKYPAILIRPLTIPLGWLDQFLSPYAFDGCCGAYFIGRKAQVSATHKEIVSGYRGAL